MTREVIPKMGFDRLNPMRFSTSNEQWESHNLRRLKPETPAA